MDSVDQAIEQANNGLSRITIVRRGRKLALRGSLPKRPGEGWGNKQTTVALGVFANPSGIKVALAKAQRLESDLNMERFTWGDWEKGGGSPGGKSAADWGKEYAAVKVATVKASTYRTNYQERLESLPDKPLTEELLLSHIQQRSKINTKGRRDDCIAFGQLAKFAGLDVDFSAVKGRYEPKPLSPDDVPSDSEIEAIWAAIANPGWKWVYGMLATYGLRPHEVFRIANTKGIATDTGKITILDDSKTGRRDVWPLPDRWRSQLI